MHYYIIENNELKEASGDLYDDWFEKEGYKYSIDDYSLIINGFEYSIETIYMGAFDDSEEVLPFVLAYFETRTGAEEDELKSDDGKDKAEYFKTFDEMINRRAELIKKIEAKIQPVQKNPQTGM